MQVHQTINFMKSVIIVGAVLLLASVTGCYYDNKQEMYGSCDSSNVTFATTIEPIINANCVGCHGSSSPSAGISLVGYDQVALAANNGRLVGTMNNTGGHMLMPPGGKLDNCKLNQVNKWIRNGLPK
jgi:hypothetical protein